MRAITGKTIWTILALVLCMATINVSGVAARAIDWNDQAINWLDYEAGLKAGSQNSKPVLLLFYADW